jgi:UDP-N-acetylmuramoylalanine-D-glutamate ligase
MEEAAAEEAAAELLLAEEDARADEGAAEEKEKEALCTVMKGEQYVMLSPSQRVMRSPGMPHAHPEPQF